MHLRRAAGVLIAICALPLSAPAATNGPHRPVVDSIIVHAIGGPSCVNGQVRFSGAPGDAARWKTFFDRHPFLGVHYVVDRDGAVLASTPEALVANHAADNNATSIGIELVHEGDGREPFGDSQIEALIRLIDSIRQRHAIALESIKGHADVDARTFSCGGQTHKGRSDPGANFPWLRVLSALIERGRPPEPQLVARSRVLTSLPRPVLVGVR